MVFVDCFGKLAYKIIRKSDNKIFMALKADSCYYICEYDYNARCLRNCCLYDNIMLWNKITDVFPNLMQAVRYLKNNIDNFI